MKQLIQVLVVCIYSICLQAQPVCTPTTYPTGYFPPPSYNDIDTMYNGIYYEDVLTVHVPDTFYLNGAPVELDSMRIDSITGFPFGITYDCDEPNCVFESPIISCMLLYGTPNDTSGVYDVKIHYCIFLPILPNPICMTYPDGQAGGYVYRLGNPSSTSIINSENDIIQGLSCLPNPVISNVNFQFTPNENGIANFKIHNTLGQHVFQKQLPATKGQPVNLMYESNHLAPGTYFYTIELNGASITKKFVRLKDQ